MIRLGSVAALLVVALLLLADVVVSPALAQTPRRGGVFRVPMPDPPGLYPHQVFNFGTQTLASFTYSHLVRFPAGPEQTRSTDSRILPDLAEKWAASADGKTTRSRSARASASTRSRR